MARRRRKHFGDSPYVHRYAAGLESRVMRSNARWVREAAATGDCHEAITAFTAFMYEQGRYDCHRQVRRSRFNPDQLAMKLLSRLKRSCVRK